MNRRNFLKGSLVLTGGLLMPSYLTSCKSRDQGYDVVVYGATSAGIIAAVQAARLGRSVILIEP